MTDAELRDAAWEELKQTTLGWDKVGKYPPERFARTHWAKAKGYLDMIGRNVVQPPTAPPGTGGAPVSNLTRPSINGSAIEGETVGLTPGTWSGSPTLTYQWQWDQGTGSWTNVNLATATTFYCSATFTGAQIRVAETANGATTVYSDPVTQSAGGGGSATVYPFAAFINGNLDEFDDSSANGSGTDVGTTILASDWVAGEHKAQLKGNSSRSPVYYDDTDNVRIHLLGNAGVESLIQLGQTFYRCQSFRITSAIYDIFAGDEIHGSGTSMSAGPQPLNGFSIRNNRINWIIRGDYGPTQNDFVQHAYGEYPRSDDNGVDRFSDPWTGLSAIPVQNTWYHTMAKFYMHETAGTFALWVCTHGTSMVNVVPEVTIPNCLPATENLYPMMSLYYDRDASGDHTIEVAAGGYCDDFATLKAWQAARLGYNPW